MTEREVPFRLTGIGERLYADRSPMPEEQRFELPTPHSVHEVHEPERPVIHTETREIFPKETEPHRQKGFIETGFPKEKLDKLANSKKTYKQELAFDLLVLNQQTSEKPLMNWSMDELQEVYDYWQGVSQKLQDREESGKKVSADAREIVEAVRKVITLAAPDKEALLTGDKKKKEFDDKKIDQIKTQAIQEAFREFILEWNDNPTVPQVQRLLKKWEELVQDPKVAKKLEKDKKGREAVERVMGKLHRVRAQRMKDAHPFSGQTDTTRPDEEPRRSRERITLRESEEEQERREREAVETRSDEERRRREEEERRRQLGQDPEDTMRQRHTIPQDTWDRMSEMERLQAVRTQEDRRSIRVENQVVDGESTLIFAGIEETSARMNRRMTARANTSDSELSPDEKKAKTERDKKKLEDRKKMSRLEYYESQLTEKSEEELIESEEEPMGSKKAFSDAERRLFYESRTKTTGLTAKEQELRNKLTGKKTENKEQVKTKWAEYGWDSKDTIKGRLAGFGVSEDDDKETLLRAILLHGIRGKEFKQILDKIDAEADRKFQENQGRLSKNDELRNYLDKMGVTGVREIDEILQGVQRAETMEDQRFKERPDSMEALAWQLGKSSPRKFGEHGENPIWERRVEEVLETTADGQKIIRLKTIEVVNQENVVKWYRDRMMYLHVAGKEEVYNFHKDVKLLKDQFNTIALDQMFEAKDTMFVGKGEDGINYEDLAAIMEIETFIAMTLRQYHLEYKKVMQVEDELKKTMRGIFMRNQMTKDLASHNNWYYLIMMAEEFDGLNSMDGKVGAVVNANLQAYSRISNIEGLTELMGEDCDLFDGKKLLEMRDRLADKQSIKKEVFFDLEGDGRFQKAFGIPKDLVESKDSAKIREWVYKQATLKLKEGDAKALNEFAALINPYHSPEQDNKLMEVFQQVIGEHNAKEYGLYQKKTLPDGTTRQTSELDYTTLEYANMLAYHIPLWTGVSAEHGTTKAGVNALERLTRGYRAKHQEGGRAGGSGNPFTITLYNQLYVNALEGIRVQSKDAVTGQKIPLMTILTKLAEVRRGKGEKGEEDYKELASKILFKQNAEMDYMNNQVIRAFELDGFIRNAEELRFEKYFKRVAEVGIVFDREQFQKDMVKKIITNARYAFKTYGDINYNEIVWGWDYEIGKKEFDEKEKKWKVSGGWRRMSQAEKMFGKEILDDEKFWKTDKDGIRIFINSDKNKELLFKRFVMGLVSGQILEHTKIAPWASGTRWEFGYIDDIIEALEKIPDGADLGEEMKHFRVTKRFFDPEMMKWIQVHAKQRKGKRYAIEFLKGLVIGDRKKKETEVGFAALGEMLQLFVTAIPGQGK